MLRNGGIVNTRRIIPEAWLADMLTAGDHQAWVDGKSNFFPTVAIEASGTSRVNPTAPSAPSASTANGSMSTHPPRP